MSIRLLSGAGHPRLLRALPVLLAALAFTAPTTTLASEAPLRFHLPDGGAPPWLYVSPGAGKPEGVVADILETAAHNVHREVRYEFLPREKAGDALHRGAADGALFFTVTRPPARELVLTTPLAHMDTVLVTRQDAPLGFRRPSDLQNRRLCTLTGELYPPLALLAMKGTLVQTRAKTEQAALLMLRGESCSAAVVNGPLFRWMAERYGRDDLRIEPRALLEEDLVLGFAARERDFADAVNAVLESMRNSGRLHKLVDRWLPEEGFASARAAQPERTRLGAR